LDIGLLTMMPPNVKNYIIEASCEDLASAMHRLIAKESQYLELMNNLVSPERRNGILELIEIRNEWIECEGSGKPLLPIPVE